MESNKLRIRALPTDAVLDREMFKAQRNIATFAGNVCRSELASFLLGSIPSSVMFAIVFDEQVVA